jgi:hypothetical protein
MDARRDTGTASIESAVLNFAGCNTYRKYAGGTRTLPLTRPEKLANLFGLPIADSAGPAIPIRGLPGFHPILKAT